MNGDNPYRTPTEVPAEPPGDPSVRKVRWADWGYGIFSALSLVASLVFETWYGVAAVVAIAVYQFWKGYREA